MDQDGTETSEYHRPVLVEEVVELVAPVIPGVVVDATFGGGGHTRRLLNEFGEDVTVVAIDRDPEAQANVGSLPVSVIQGNFGDLKTLLDGSEQNRPSAILFDFGVSSRQLDDGARGFSFRNDGPLDMRMGPDASSDAGEIVNGWPEKDLAGIIAKFGEEPMARRIARAIVASRPIKTTAQLSTVIAEATPAARRRAGHPARRTFQAIRIAVNDELTSVADGIDDAIDMVAPGGRVIAISYHSLEDRIVKQRFAEGATGCICPPELPVCGCGVTAELRVLTRKPVRSSATEIEANPRSRSAILRAAEKVAA